MSLIFPFLFGLLFFKVKGSERIPTEKPAFKALSPKEKPYYVQERFLEANFFQDYFISFSNMKREDFLTHIEYFFIPVAEREDFIKESGVNIQILTRMESLGSFLTSLKRVSYLVRAKERPKLPNCSIDDLLQDSSLLTTYVNYFLDVYEVVFEGKLPESPDKHQLLIEKREVFFRGAYHIWITVMKLKQAELGLKLLDHFKYLGSIMIEDSEEDQESFEGGQITLYYHSRELIDVVTKKAQPQISEFSLFPLFDFAKSDSSLKQSLPAAQKTLLNLFSTVESNNECIERDFDKFDSFRTNLLNLKLLPPNPKDSMGVSRIKASVDYQIKSLLGPSMQKYIPQYAEPTSFAHMVVQLINEYRFLERMMRTSFYPFRLFAILRNSYHNKVLSVQSLISYMEDFYREHANLSLYRKLLDKIPKFDNKVIPPFCFYVDIYNPKDFLQGIFKMGIPQGALPSFPKISTPNVQVVFQSINNLLSGLAYFIFSSCLFHLSKPDATPLFKEADRPADIEKFLESKYLPYKKVAFQTLEYISDSEEKKFIVRFTELVEAWIRAKCFYLFNESDPVLAVAKTCKIFPLPVNVLGLNNWFTLDLILWQRSMDPKWREAQLSFLGHLEIITKYIDQNRIDKK